MTVNGVFAREAGEGMAFAEGWDAVAAYAAASADYTESGAVSVDFRNWIGQFRMLRA